MGLDEQISTAKGLIDSDPKQAEQELRKLVFDVPGTDVETTRVKEQAIGALAEAYVKLQDAQSLADLLSQLREFFGAIPKAKTAKIVRGIIDQIAKIPNSTQLQVVSDSCGTARCSARIAAA
jgi:26S proteasome regulatory subunit N6